MSDASCAWKSASCTGAVVLHRVQEGDSPLREVLLCSDFHGQYWPRVGEEQADYLRRTARVRAQMTTPERRRRAAIRLAAARRRGQENRQENDETPPS